MATIRLHAGRARRIPLALALGIAFAQGESWAEPKQGADAATQQVLRKAQGMLRQLAQDKAALEAEKASLSERVQKLEDEVRRLAPLQEEVERYKTGAEAMKNAYGALESRLSQGMEREQALRARHKNVLAKAKQIQADNALLVQAVKEREEWIGQCAERNRGMLSANLELLEKYRDKGFWEQLGDAEPLTGIGKVETENRTQDYRFKLEDLKITPFRAETQTPADAQNASSASESAPAGKPDDEEDEDD